jgi:hypothetical protein
VSVAALELACVLSAVLGAVILFARRATWAAVACLLLIAPTATRVDIAMNVPMRLGDVARALPDQDVLDLERVASAHGVSPWLIRGPGDQLPDTESIEAYGTPKVTTVTLRRGTVTTLVRHRRADRGAWTPWTIDSRSDYAQVAPTDEGFVWLEDDRDAARPFRVVGAVPDADLVSLVKLIRVSATVHGRWPIVLIRRQTDGTVDVMLRAKELAGQHVTLRLQSGTWVIVGVRSWTL